MTLVNAALVRALGQVELLFSFAISIWFFRERVQGAEIAGAVLVVLGIWLLL
jgi:drug/metabolite transporter (DMT)-like permease